MSGSLERRMRDVLAEASLIAEAPASSPERHTSSGKPGSKILRSMGMSVYDRCQERLSGAGNVQERQRAVEWCEDLVQGSKRQRHRELTAKQEEYWVLVASQGRDYRDVAADYGLRPETVWKRRSEAGYEPRKGRPKEKAA